jgi:hypothetical protein
MSDCQGLGDCDDTRMQRIYEYLDGAFTHAATSRRSNSIWMSCPECTQQYDLECVIRVSGEAFLYRGCAGEPEERHPASGSTLSTARRRLTQAFLSLNADDPRYLRGSGGHRV